MDADQMESDSDTDQSQSESDHMDMDAIATEMSAIADVPKYEPCRKYLRRKKRKEEYLAANPLAAKQQKLREIRDKLRKQGRLQMRKKFKDDETHGMRMTVFVCHGEERPMGVLDVIEKVHEITGEYPVAARGKGPKGVSLTFPGFEQGKYVIHQIRETMQEHGLYARADKHVPLYPPEWEEKAEWVKILDIDPSTTRDQVSRHISCTADLEIPTKKIYLNISQSVDETVWCGIDCGSHENALRVAEALRLSTMNGNKIWAQTYGCRKGGTKHIKLAKFKVDEDHETVDERIKYESARKVEMHKVLKGKLKYIPSMKPDKRGGLYVKFETEKDAEKMGQYLNGKEVLGRQLMVMYVDMDWDQRVKEMKDKRQRKETRKGLKRKLAAERRMQIKKSKELKAKQREMGIVKPLTEKQKRMKEIKEKVMRMNEMKNGERRPGLRQNLARYVKRRYGNSGSSTKTE